MPSPNVILVEDDTALRESLMECFMQSGIQAAEAGTALQFYRLLASHPCDIVVLDIGLPDEDGLSVLRFLRQEKPEIGVILMTARASVEDRVSGRKSGADLYLTKPVTFAELEAAIFNLSQRLRAQARPNAEAGNENIWLFQRQAFRLVAPNNTSITLTNKECRLFNVLSSAGEATIPRDDLLGALGYSQTDAGHRSLNAALVRLRAKVKELTGMDIPIQTVRGQGYVARNLHSE